MATFDLSQARALCTPAELRVVKTASEPSLANHSVADLKKHVGQARKLRDKWRDLSTRQRREVQKAQGSRATDKAGRSKEKADLFGEVLTRLEARLAKQVGSSDTAAVQKGAASDGPPKSERTQEHRATRAQVREELGAKQAEWNAPAQASSAESAKPGTKKKAAKKKAAKKKVANQPAAKKTSPAAAQADASAAGGGKKKVAKKAARKGTKKATAKKQSPPASAPVPKGSKQKAGASSLGEASQKSAKTAAKRERIKTSGLDTRIRGHVSARGKRAQGRRDSRGGR